MKKVLMIVSLLIMFGLGALVSHQVFADDVSDKDMEWLEKKEEVQMELQFYRYHHDDMVKGIQNCKE